MTLLGYVLLLTAAIYCAAAPDNSCGRPERMVEAELVGDWESDRYPGGTQAVYQCRPGYTRQGTIKMACIGGEWQYFGKKGECKKRPCGHPGDLKFGTFELTKEETFVFGAVVTYSCEEGYRMASKERVRQCTATGWSNYLPECDVMNCPPIAATDNLNVLSTSYDDEYTVGQVVKFECKAPNLKLNGASEIFCTSEGNWNLDPPTCTEIKCNRPRLDKGKVNNPGKEVFSNNEMIQYTCIDGYRPNKNGDSTCTKDDWYPEPSCTEITCNPPQVQKGSVDARKAVYKYEEEIEVKCFDGHVLNPEPNKPRKCTINGWVPPPNCVSKKCDKPNIINGYLYYGWGFPKSPGSSIDYRCIQNYLTPLKDYWERIQCTKFGWDPEPRCLRQCSYSKANFENAEASVVENIYLEGEEVTFRCKSPFLTTDGKTSGIRTCLPDGEFTTAKCSTIGEQCGPPPTVQFGDTTGDRKISYKSGEKVDYRCPNYYTLKGDIIVMCLNGVWGEAPVCLEPCITKKRNLEENNIQLRWKESEKLYTRHGDITEFICKPGYDPLPDTNMRTTCEHGKLDYPKCIRNGYCILQQSKMLANNVNYNENTVVNHGQTITFQCNEDMMEETSLQATCTSGNIVYPKCTAPIPCSAPPLLHGKYTPRKREFSNGEYLQYECDKGYMTEKHNLLATAQCLNGELSEIPKCIAITCEHDSSLYKDEDVITYSCPHGKRPKSDLVQCFNYGWGPPVICQEEKPGQPDATNPPPDDIEPEEKRQKCPLAHSPKNAEIIDLKEAYYSNDQVTMKCNKGYSMYGSATIRCIAGKWEQPPECYELGDQCGPPPTIEFGDIIEMRKFSYRSGEIVEYQCPIYHVFKGDKIVECLNGVWGEAPVCLKPCTAKEDSMYENNIQPKLEGEEKIYLTHGDELEFNCIFGHEALPNTQMIITCKHGKLEYPNCLKKGFCILQQSEMIANNIHYNKSTVVERGQTITFQCNEAMIPEKGLEATCRLGKIQYPKCTAANLSV